MQSKITFPFFLFFFTTFGIAQSRKQLQGQILVVDANVSDVLILNLNTQEEVKSNTVGIFIILAKATDVLVCSSKNLDYMRKIIEEDEVIKGKFEIQMTSKQIVLDEVEIKSYNAVDLGILQQPAKRYTAMERKLRTAGDFKPIHLLGLLAGSMELDPVFNAINGKTKRLKKEIKLERSQKRLLQFQAFFSRQEMIQTVKINPDEVSEFTYSVLDKEEFITLLDAKDKSKMLFYLIQNYTQFQNIKQSNENK